MYVWAFECFIRSFHHFRNLISREFLWPPAEQLFFNCQLEDMQPSFLLLLGSYLLLITNAAPTTESDSIFANHRNSSSFSSSTLIDQLFPVLAFLPGTTNHTTTSTTTPTTTISSPSSTASNSSSSLLPNSSEQLDNHISNVAWNKMQQNRRHRRRKNRHHQTLLDRFQLLDNRIESVEQLSASLQQHQLQLLSQLNETLHSLNQPIRKPKKSMTADIKMSNSSLSDSVAAAAGSAAADQLHLLARLHLQLRTLRDLQQLLEMPGNETLLAARPAEYSVQEFVSSPSSQHSLLTLLGPPSQQPKPANVPSLTTQSQTTFNSSSTSTTNLTGPWQRSFFRRLSQLTLRNLTPSDQLPLSKAASFPGSLEQLLNNRPTTPAETAETPSTQLEGDFPTLAAQAKASNCSVRPMLQTLTEAGCEPKEIKINFCYGHCASFFLPGLHEPTMANFSSPDNVADQSLGDPVQPEEITRPQMRSCPSCLPAHSRWLHVRLNCPALNPPHMLRRVQLIQKCRCQT